MPAQPLINGRPGVAIHFKGSEQAMIFRPIKYRKSGIDENSFATLPSGGYICTDWPRIREQTYKFDKYKTWQKTWCTSSSMVFLGEFVDLLEKRDQQPPPVRPRFALKVAFYVTGNSSDGGAMMEKYRQEALFYKERLSEVEGIAVPKHYGVWRGKCSWGPVIAISIMQWGGWPYGRFIRDGGRETHESKMAVVKAFHALHKTAHIEHGGYDLDYAGHLLYNPRENTACVIDFSYGNLKHKCELRMDPFQSYDSIPPTEVFGCEELSFVSIMLGLTKVDSYYDDPKMLELIAQYKKECDEKRQRRRAVQQLDEPTGGEDEARET